MADAVVRLVVRDGSLFIPSSAMDAENREWFGDAGALLVYRYPAGDYDIIPYPLSVSGSWRSKLRSCLFDARECGRLPVDAQEVELPNGERFPIEA